MVNTVELLRITREYISELHRLEQNKLYVASQERAALEALRAAYLPVRDEKLRHENDAWQDRMREKLQQDIDSIRRAQQGPDALIASEEGRGQLTIEMETARTKLTAMEALLEKRDIEVVRENDHVRFEGPGISLSVALQQSAEIFSAV